MFAVCLLLIPRVYYLRYPPSDTFFQIVATLHTRTVATPKPMPKFLPPSKRASALTPQAETTNGDNTNTSNVNTTSRNSNGTAPTRGASPTSPTAHLTSHML